MPSWILGVGAPFCVALDAHDEVSAVADTLNDVILKGFQEFDRRAAPVNATPLVTLQKRGLMSLNRTAFELIGQPTAVTLLYHPERRLIGLRSTDPNNPRAYPMRRQGGRESSGGSFLVAGTAFTVHHQIPTDVARRYVAKLVGDVLMIDLNDDAPVVTGPRAKDGKPTV